MLRRRRHRSAAEHEAAPADAGDARRPARASRELRGRSRNGDGLTIGAGVTLTELVRDAAHARARTPGLWQAAAQVATPHLRNMGTLGGNLCLDTRCNYYDQNYEWRKAIDFCMKKDGDDLLGRDRRARSAWRCRRPTRRRCCMALGATVTLVSARRRRARSPSPTSIANDGIHYLTRQPDEILTGDPRAAPRRLAQHLLEAAAARRVRLPGAVGRRRGEARRRTGRSRTRASCSARSRRGRSQRRAAAAALVGRRLTDEAIARRRRTRRAAGQADGQHRLRPASGASG